jgi:cytochrome c
MFRKILALSFIAAVCFSCGNDPKAGSSTSTTSTTSTDKPAAPAADALSSNPDYQKGLALIAKSDCLTCHKVDETSTGPAYRDVANKYTNDEKTIATLADKVMKGGSGNWGAIPMVPHPAISIDDAKQMVKYVLLLRNK